MNAKIYFIVVTALISLTLISCPSGGGGGDSNITLSDLAGTQTLIDFEIQFDSGSTVDPDDVRSHSGTMIISSDGTATQTIEINGSVSTTYADIIKVSPTGMIVRSTECGEYNIVIQLSGNRLTTTWPSGTCGTTWQEMDLWEKINSEANYDNFDHTNAQIAIDEEQLLSNPGGLIGDLYDYLP